MSAMSNRVHSQTAFLANLLAFILFLGGLGTLMRLVLYARDTHAGFSFLLMAAFLVGATVSHNTWRMVFSGRARVFILCELAALSVYLVAAIFAPTLAVTSSVVPFVVAALVSAVIGYSLDYLMNNLHWL